MSWKATTIGSVCNVIAGQSPESSFYNKDGKGLAFYQGKKDFGEKYISEPTVWTTHITKEAEQGDILMSVRAPVGPVNFATQRICIGRGLAAIRAKKEINKDYLFYFLRKIESELVGSSGAVFNSINKSQIASIKIPLPLLATQQKIVEKLDSIFAEIDRAIVATEANVQNAEALFQRYLTDVIERGGQGWKTKSVKELVSEKIIYKPFDGNHGEIHPVASDYTPSGIPFLMASDLKDGLADLDNCKFLPKTITDKLRVGFAKNNDILITHKGTIGRVAKLKTDLDYVMLTPQITSYRIVNEEFLSEDYLFYFFLSNYFQNQINEMAKDGSTRAYAGITKQNSLLIKIPPIQIQNNFSNIFRQLEIQTSNLKLLNQFKINKFKSLQKSILKEAFTGELVKE